MIQVISSTGEQLLLTNSPKQAKAKREANEGSTLAYVEDY